ncbi:hypothetical protein [Sphingobacterium suaedae]|uniref:Galectin n=1 Tax=Sphingobacterium suaedae TaxID=1686402 RepID=A0ABW5KHV5_9SPHI
MQHDVTVMGSLYCKNPVGSSPHSAFFLVRNTEGKSSDLKNYWVDFKSWKRSKTQLRDTQFTYYYELPGVYFPVLGYKGKALDTTRVVLNSDGWEVTAELEHDSLRVYPVAMHAPSFSNPPTVSSSAVYHAGVDTLKTFFLNYAWVKETGIQADNMEFSVDLKTSPNRPGVRCSQVNLVLYGERDKHYITLIKPQCSSWAHYKFSELEKDGERDDLRAFGHDLTAGRNVRVRIKNQMVFIFLENKQIFTTRYERPIGRLLGINIMFSGIGKISSPTWVSL